MTNLRLIKKHPVEICPCEYNGPLTEKEDDSSEYLHAALHSHLQNSKFNFKFFNTIGSKFERENLNESPEANNKLP